MPSLWIDTRSRVGRWLGVFPRRPDRRPALHLIGDVPIGQVEPMPHYITVGDGNGKRARLVAKTLIRLTCSRAECGSRVWVDWKPGADPTTFGLPHECYACGSPLHREWGAGQLAFVPEADLGLDKVQTGDLVEIKHAGTEDLPADWAESVTEDLKATDPTKPDRPPDLPTHVRDYDSDDDS